MYNIGLTASLARPAIPLVSNCDPLILVTLPLQTGQFTEVYKTIPHKQITYEAVTVTITSVRFKHDCH